METITAYHQRVVQESREYVIERDKGIVYIAHEDPYPTGEVWSDCCGYATYQAGEWWTNCDYCQRKLGEAMSRLNDVFHAVINYDVDALEAIERVADRERISVAVIEDFGWPCVVDLEDMRRGFEPYNHHQALVITLDKGARDYARDCVATMTNRTWVVGRLPEESFDQENFDLYTDCEDVCHGFIWSNVDDYGASSPEPGDLVEAI